MTHFISGSRSYVHNSCGHNLPQHYLVPTGSKTEFNVTWPFGVIQDYLFLVNEGKRDNRVQLKNIPSPM